MGLLLLSSLEEKRHIRIENLSQNEAEKFIKDLEARVSAERTLKTPDTRITDSFKVYRLIASFAPAETSDSETSRPSTSA